VQNCRASPSKPLTVQVGEDTTQIRHDSNGIAFDDSFEHTFVGSADDAPWFLIHAQVCHPDLHERALDTPSSECVSQDEL
jgi:hypothetical protein